MAVAVPEAPFERTPGIPDDVIDPPAPPGAIAPLPERTLSEVYDALHALGRILDGAFDKLPPLFEQQERGVAAMLAQHATTLSGLEASTLQHLCDVLDQISVQGLTVLPAPYSATVHATMPSGYACTITIAHREGGAFLAALQNLEQWLHTAGYTPLRA